MTHLLLLALATEGLLPPGVWESRGYGYVLVVGEDKVKRVDVSGAGCVEGETLPREVFRERYGRFVEGMGLDRWPTRDRLQKREAAPQGCKQTRDAMTNLEVFLGTFAEHYAFLKERGAGWEERAAKARARVRAGGDLFEAMVEVVGQLGDGHVTIEAGKKVFPVEDAGWGGKRRALREAVPGAKLVANRRVIVGRLEGNVGYVGILAEGGWAEELTEESAVERHVEAARRGMDEILSEMTGVKGIVLDLRVNSGGLDAVAMEVASRFCTEPKVAMRKRAGREEEYPIEVKPGVGKRYTGPVIVLVGKDTVSAGETLAQAMKALPGVRVWGEATRGELSDMIPKRLPNGWSFTLSMERVSNAEGVLLEKRGVDVEESLGEGWKQGIEKAARRLAQ